MVQNVPSDVVSPQSVIKTSSSPVIILSLWAALGAARAIEKFLDPVTDVPTEILIQSCA